MKKWLLNFLPRTSATPPWTGEEAIREELFSAERLEQHAHSLATAQTVSALPHKGQSLNGRLYENETALLTAYRAIAAAVHENRPITPAAEWLIDNFHLAEDQIREIHTDLPASYYRELPKLSEGPFAGYPRIFEISWAFVAHTDSRFDADLLRRFVLAYQRVQPLTIGELWALPISIRIVLVENLRRLADLIVGSQASRDLADALVEKFFDPAHRAAQSGDAPFDGSPYLPLTRAFAVQLLQRLRDEDPATTPALRWLDRRLIAQGTTADTIVREEHQRQGAANVSVRNIFNSMRLISEYDWAEFFESISLVDGVMRSASNFADMDFPTRDRYRRAIEDLARHSNRAEIDVAQATLRLAQRAQSGPLAGAADQDSRRTEPGYYLLGGGRRGFEKQLGYRTPLWGWLIRANAAIGLAGYLTAVMLVAGAALGLTLMFLAEAEIGTWTMLALAVPGMFVAIDAAIPLVNRAVTNRFGPAILAGLALRDGVTREFRTIVVVPALLAAPADAEELVERLEVHFLASAEGDIRFALLSDWPDSNLENAPGDAEILAAASEGIARLNAKYGPAPEGPRFLLLHRRRVWNEGQGQWIGWERKRGKLHELNRLLRGLSDTTFLPIDGSAPQVPPGTRYVITLDADTRLPMGAAKRLIGKMAHPLNRPKFDAARRRVVSGYGILQPRVTPSLPAVSDGSIYQRVFSSPTGIDPYAAAVSDVYQDLFDEGSYSGKGIYDVDAFEAALGGRIPDSAILSHDLLEGIFARAGLVSDVEVFEDFPARYDVAASRQHRWARGDWQLLPWILNRVPAGPDNPGSAGITALGRWKLLDNLRRSLSAPAMVLALLLGWLALPPPASLLWSAFVVLPIFLTAFMPLISRVLPRRTDITPLSHFRAFRADFRVALLQLGLQVALLAHQAWLMIDAIARTLHRLHSGRRLLEWITMAATGSDRALAPGNFLWRMAGAMALAGCGALLVASLNGANWLLAAPFVAAWMLSPMIAWATSLAPRSSQAPLTDSDAETLRLVARRTWLYFETFVTAEDHWLPPDNFQEIPRPVLARRTSPTNIGLYLLSILAARDFGWLGVGGAVDHLEAALDTMDRLERSHGHFYNWYATRDLRPLEPRYISSVDSGNLAGHLIVLRSACKAIKNEPALEPERLSGIADAVELAERSLDKAVGGRHKSAEARAALEALAAALHALSDCPAAGVAALLDELTRQSAIFSGFAHALAADGKAGDCAEVVVWAESVATSVALYRRDIEILLPWVGMAGGPPTSLRAERVLRSVPSLADLPAYCRGAIEQLDGSRLAGSSADPAAPAPPAPGAALIVALEGAARAAETLLRRLDAIEAVAVSMYDEMQFAFLLDPARQLLSIGYQVVEDALDPNCYDLLASEARLASFIAIAKGDIAPKHWFNLGRALTPIDRGAALISWSGSMFEYLMPELVMREPAGSLLYQTARLVVSRQIAYGQQLGVPWGVSESAYNFRDLEMTYQYSNFGVPGLGLKRGLSKNLVIAPYATALAAMIAPAAAVVNFRHLAQAGGRGRYGWYEALDYTPERLAEGKNVAVVRAYMAHHQGMTVVAIANALLDGRMRQRFHADPAVQAAELLLQERPPRDVAVKWVRAEEVSQAIRVRELVPTMLRRFHSPHDPIPRTHLLSNGRYAVLVTAAGSGFSRWGNLAVSRWREDVSCDPWGSYIYLRDVDSGLLWSAGYQPTGARPDSYEVAFSEDRAEIIRRDGTLVTTLDIVVSPEDDGEVRRVSIFNSGARAREIEVTSYSEIVLAPPADDAAHQAFSKLFVQTEFVPELGGLLATRRKRSPGDPDIWAAHLCIAEGESVGELQYETDRARFLGRGNAVRSPRALGRDQALSNSAGTVLDAIFSIRRRVRVPPGATVRLSFWTLLARSREEVISLADKHRDVAAFERAATLAWTQAQVELHHTGVSSDEAHLFQRLANRIIYADPSLRPPSEILMRNELSPSALWAHSISGDLPIVLCQIAEPEDLDTVRQLLRAHSYWRTKLLAADLVIVNERTTSYVQDLQSDLEALVRVYLGRSRVEQDTTPGSVFLLRADLLTLEVRALLQTVARVVIVCRRGSLTEQVKRAHDIAPAAGPPLPRTRNAGGPPLAAPPPLEFFNDLGGFDRDGREYVTILDGSKATPAPWINVIANPDFGFHVAAEGGGFTWSVNSRENQITPWSNDPVSDVSGEAIYVRDEDSGEFWSPTAFPIRDEAGRYIARHGQGYSRFEHESRGIALELTQFVAVNDPVKISRLKIINRSGRRRRLTVSAYVEWQLGPSRAACAPYIVTEIEPDTGAMLARNPWRMEFGSRVAFADLAGRQTACCGDRTEFIGRNGSLALPAALARRAPLSNRVGAGFDPCGVVQQIIEIAAGGEAEATFTMGETATRAEAIALVQQYRSADLDQVFAEVTRYWDDTLGAVQVRTPDRALDIMINRWLLYQTIVCRLWARAGFYQASGAYGFRDQLQDGMAVCLARPELARAHLLRAAAQQFTEGDVQHWWLPSSGKGIRTRISDDLLWLPFTAAHYVGVTADRAVLDEPVRFIEGMILGPLEQDAFFQPMPSDQQASLYEHCARAIDRSLAVGRHGLPLIGAGDWNDGMNRVGVGGHGESVWLGWFLLATIANFIPLAEQRGEHERAASWRQHAASLTEALERDGWDGAWYRRGYFDDGSPLGSAANSECRIDSIAQSWAVLSGAANPARAAQAMASVDENLILRDQRLALLFAPPFDKTPLDPGYIKGYPPGIRENGGQYSHAALWSVQAIAKLGRGDQAGELMALLNPINHARTLESARHYKVEPYVVCADIYSVPPHSGRGGWTWYTGSSGWMYRAGLESILGFYVEGNRLRLDPCVPAGWRDFEITYRRGTASYKLSVDNRAGAGRGVSALRLDGKNLDPGTDHIDLIDDGAIHNLHVVLG